MIYTSYFAFVKNHPELVQGRRVLSIALHNPDGWPIDDWAHPLKPWPFMIDQFKNGQLTEYGYEFRYRECVLSNKSADWIADYYDNSIFVCYETPDKFCHRHIVRKWLAEYGHKSEELGVGNLVHETGFKAAETVIQTSLF